MMMKWLRLRDRLHAHWTPSWVQKRHTKFSRLARLNIDATHYRNLTPEEETERQELRRYHTRHINSWWRTAFL